MKKRRKRTTSPVAIAGEDRISASPDEVLHCILRRLESHRQSAQTTAISSRWRNLWRSYPVVEVDADWQTKNSSIRANKYLENFCATAINKFFQHKEFFRIETLKVSIRLDASVGSRSPILQRLLDLAWQRKVQEFAVKFECADLLSLFYSSSLFRNRSAAKAAPINPSINLRRNMLWCSYCLRLCSTMRQGDFM
ncbi:unnamed protein product [Linum tenue]|uniref:F-box domain-containing protein n=1 Tax=Linum tenue TaxID=586396 RepID=A0AAV0L945_9ROSI|nr:unnamed protein product [Linum tenue]